MQLMILVGQIISEIVFFAVVRINPDLFLKIFCLQRIGKGKGGHRMFGTHVLRRFVKILVFRGCPKIGGTERKSPVF